jgi:hypothetical protein
MAGAGYKLFSTGDVLSASDVNTYLMQQTVMSFATAAARTTALSGVLAEGMVSYLQDTDVVQIYTGAAWVSLDDPNAIQNTIVTAKGDIIGATAASTPARLAVGANNTFLVADSTAATGLKYGGTWTTWTPSWSGLTVGNGTTTARYQQVGNTVFYFIKFVMGTTSVVTGDVNYSVPVGSVANALYNGVSEYIDTGTQDFGGTVEYAGAQGYFRLTNVAGTYAT